MLTPSFTIHALVDPHDRLDYARQLLHHQPSPNHSHPIALLLFTLDTLAYIHSSDLHRGDGKRPISGVGDSHRLARRELEPVHSTNADSPPPSDPLVPWSSWIDYLAQVYLLPLSSDSASTSSSWVAPLHLSSDISSYLEHLAYSPIFDDSTRTLLLAAARTALAHLASPPQPASPSQSPVQSASQTALDMLMTEVSSPTFPHPLPSSTVSSIAQTLATQRSAGGAYPPEPDKSRSVLTALLGHYVSPTFRERRDGADKIRYADDPADDRLVRAVFPSIDEEPADAPSSSLELDRDRDREGEHEVLVSDEDDADTRSIATGIREAHASIARKENKLRQLLGDQWQNPGVHAHPPSATSSPVPVKRNWTPRGAATPTSSMASSGGNTVRPQPSSSTLRRRASYGSDLSRVSTGQTYEQHEGQGHHHHRLVSTSSSQTPLIDSPAPSPVHASASPGKHRRGLSTPVYPSPSPAAGLAPVSLAPRAGQPPLSPALPTPALQPDPLAPHAAAVPFADLAPAVPSPSVVRSGASSPRRTSLDSSLDYVYGVPRLGTSSSPASAGPARLPLNRNALTAHEKRALVRRSKKLEGFFGATFQEAAAQRVLVAQGQVPPVPRARGAGGGEWSRARLEVVRPSPSPERGRWALDDGAEESEPSTPVRATTAAGGVEDEPVSPTTAAFPRPSSSGAVGGGANKRASIASTSSAASLGPAGPGAGAGRRASLAPPSPHGHWGFHPGPSPSYHFGRRPSVLSHASSFSSLGTGGGGSPSRSPRPSSIRSTSGAGGPSSTRMHRSSSSPSRRSSSFSSLASPEYAYFSLAPRRMSTFEREEQAREREERRRKLEKVRRVLGERVPVGLVVAGGGGEEKAGGVPMGKSRSAGGVGGRWMGMLGGGGGAAAKAKDADASPVGARTGGDAGWQYVEPEAAARARIAQREKGGAERERAEGRDGAAGRAVEQLARARKLENLFGDLPPSSLYSPAPVFSSPFAHRRSVSTGTALSPSPGPLDPFTAPSPAAPLPLSLALRRYTTTSTVESYRQNLASLDYIAERDPGALDDIARVYEGQDAERAHEREIQRASTASVSGSTVARLDGGAGSDAEEDEDEDEEAGAAGGAGAPMMSRSASASSHRAVRQAQKLSAFFGTTRGEVWHLLLDDLAAQIVDDVTLEDEERDEVLSGVERLRARARV
ncbi:hypothetical protein JCM10207_008142 [Rhodosporidiobolus poonsookiae]